MVKSKVSQKYLREEKSIRRGSEREQDTRSEETMSGKGGNNKKESVKERKRGVEEKTNDLMEERKPKQKKLMWGSAEEDVDAENGSKESEEEEDEEEDELGGYNWAAEEGLVETSDGLVPVEEVEMERFLSWAHEEKEDFNSSDDEQYQELHNRYTSSEMIGRVRR